MLQRSVPKLSIVNIVATAELGQPVELSRLASVHGFLYDQAIYHCAYLKDQRTKGKVSIFVTGRMICVGTKSLEAAKNDLNYAARRLVELGLISRVSVKPKLRNIVATTQLGIKLDLERLTRTLPSVIYEPEQFPAAIYHAKDLETASVLVFSNGKIVFAGLRTTQQLKMARKVAASLIVLAHLSD